MGLFKKKKRTETQTEKVTTTLNKIVKLTYIQSLAVNGGLVDARTISGETDATKEEFKDVDKAKDKLSKLATPTALAAAGSYLFGINPIIGSKLIQGLFGKKVTKDVSVTVEDSGWSLVKTWSQPQFDVIRYAIGIKELTVSQFTYVPVSEIVSKPWAAPKEITKVVLRVDQFIPPQFPPGIFIEYYIKPDVKDSDWIRINALDAPTQYNDKGLIVPRIITFNTERPVSSRLEDAYVNTEEPVKSIRFKAILKRPEALTTFSPVLKNYRLVFSLRNGL